MAKKTNKSEKDAKKIVDDKKKEVKNATKDSDKTTKKVSDEVKKPAKKTTEKATKDSKKAAEKLSDDTKKTTKKIKAKAKEIADEIDESTQEFQEEAKSTANEFTTGAKEAYQDFTSNVENKKILAGILAIILGPFGVHKFILGYQKEGLIMLLITILTCGFGAAITSIIGLIEGIIYLTKTDEDFYQTYQIGKKPWF